MKKIHITESQLVELSRTKLEEAQGFGANQTPTSNNGNNAQGQTQGQTQPQTTNSGQEKTIETPEGAITTNSSTKTTVVSLNNRLNNSSTAKTDARNMLQQNGVQFNPQKTTVTDNSDGIPTPIPANVTSPEAATKKTEIAYNVGDKLKPMIALTEDFITKKDIIEARRQRLISESTPYTKGELFGVVAESGKMYNFKFNDGETYKVSGEKVDDFRKYVFEHDGSKEGKDYIIEKIG